jgi:hypothetical protein
MNEDNKLIKLNGNIIKADGSEEKSNFFKFLELYQDDYSDIAFTPDEARRIQNSLKNLSTGSASAIPLICGGAARCPFASRCPYVRVDIDRKLKDIAAKPVTPVGRQCLVELDLMNEWTRLYIMEFEVDEKSFTEFQLVRELAEIEVMLWRLNNNLAKPENSMLTKYQAVGVDGEGKPIMREEVSPIFEAKERLTNRKSKLQKLMVGDPQEKYKKAAALKQVQEDDPSVTAARLRQQVEKFKEQSNQLQNKLDEIEGNIIDVTPVETTPEDIINGK